MNREVQGVLLILIGAATLRISLGDTYLRYVKENMQPYLIASGIILLILGIWSIIDVIRSPHSEESAKKPESESSGLSASATPAASSVSNSPAAGASSVSNTSGASVETARGAVAATTGDDHGHTHQLSRMAWMLVLPVVAILVVAPPALGAYSANRGATTVQSDGLYTALPPGDPVEVSVTSYASRAIWDDGKTLEGRNVEMTGFVTPDPDGGWWLTRLTLSCCAADALVSKIKVLDAPDLPANTWVSVEGSWVPGGGTQDDRAIPFVEVTDVQEVPAPKNTYE